MPVEVRVDGTMRFPEDVQIAFYRVAQESLNNVARHAQATKVRLSLICSGPDATLTISDDGRGFDAAANNSGMGLVIMRERIGAIGGDLQVRSESKSGTTITVHWNNQVRNRGNDDD